jgi:CheY-like chemotaxis protein
MVAKRALVVDDSKSARVFLAKLLEQHGVEVDSAESAEEAIDYLLHNRPDVIFMDHLMPGMDGFQAVQAIKSDLRTATIPILMYTSQEGELYMGQARALGAVGVLPKQTAPTDVKAVLQQLHLLDTMRLETIAESEVDAGATVPVRAFTTLETMPIPTSVIEQLRDDLAVMRRQLAAQVEEHNQRVLATVREAVRDAAPAPMASLPAASEPVVQLPPHQSTWPWFLALAASAAAATLGTMWWQSIDQTREARAQLIEARQEVKAADARAAAALQAQARLSSITPAAALADLPASVVRIPFGEMPFSGARIAQLEELVSQLAASGRHGTLEVRRYAGRFCLDGNKKDGYSLADPVIPYLKCGLVADSSDRELSPDGVETVAFASALASLRKKHGALIEIDVGEGGAENPQHSYPEIGGTPPRVPTAGEWNAAAEANNRVEMRWRPAT